VEMWKVDEGLTVKIEKEFPHTSYQNILTPLLECFHEDDD
jgi:hypothetical protein